MADETPEQEPEETLVPIEDEDVVDVDEVEEFYDEHELDHVAPVFTGSILSLIPAEPGWRALYRHAWEPEPELTRVVAWALVEEDGQRRVLGMVVDGGDPSRIVPAPEGGSPEAPA